MPSPSLNSVKAGGVTKKERYRFIKYYKVLAMDAERMSWAACYGNRVQLPESALMELHLNEYHYPFMFRFNHKDWSTHCGVWDFNAPSGKVVLPPWVMEHLHLTPGENVRLEKVLLPTGEFVKIAPTQVDFFHDIPEPFKELERQLKNFSCLTVGDVIRIKYKFKDYSILIKELRPQKAVCVIDTTMNLDFDVPPDYYQKAQIDVVEQLLAKDRGHRLGETTTTSKMTIAIRELSKFKRWWMRKKKSKTIEQLSQAKVNPAFDEDSINRRRSLLQKNSLKQNGKQTVASKKNRKVKASKSNGNNDAGRDVEEGTTNIDNDDDVEYQSRRLSLIKRGQPDFDYRIGSIYFTRNLDYFLGGKDGSQPNKGLKGENSKQRN